MRGKQLQLLHGDRPGIVSSNFSKFALHKAVLDQVSKTCSPINDIYLFHWSYVTCWLIWCEDSFSEANLDNRDRESKPRVGLLQ